jgi:hypothetical protein
MQPIKTTLLLYRPYILVAFLVVSIVVSQVVYDLSRPPFTTKIKLARRELVPYQALPYVHFGFKAVLADMYWIRTVQDFVAWNGKEPFFVNYFKNIATLDSRFEYPYLFAIFTVPQNKNVETLDTVREVADIGIGAIPTSWKIPFYLGTQYFLFTKTYTQAEYYLKLASEKDDAPTAVYLMYTNFVTNNIKGFRATRELIKTIYNTTDDKTIRALAKKGLEQEALNQMLENAILAYKTKYGIYPSSVEDLEKKRFVSFPEEFLTTFTVELNQRNGTYKIMERK